MKKKFIYICIALIICTGVVVVLNHNNTSNDNTEPQVIEESTEEDNTEDIKKKIESINIQDPDEEKEEKTYPEYEGLEFIYYGSFGSLIIPNADISVGLQYVATSDDDKTAQGYVDQENMAAFMPMGYADLIADHVSQEFRKLYDCEIGDIAYIDTGNHIKAYKCTRIEFGTNEGKYIADKDGHDITEDHVYVMYTCTSNSYNILLTFWEPLDD